MEEYSEAHNVTWRGIAIEITFTPERFGMTDHIEVKAEDGRPLPVTETGYRSHFIPAGTIADYGGAVAFMICWLDHEAQRTRWSSAQQLGLFD